MKYRPDLEPRTIPTYEQLKNGLLGLIEQGKISREDADMLLPELRESEDERMIESLITIVECAEIDGHVCGADAERKIAWLEKQKKHQSLPGVEDNNGIPGKDFIPVDWVDACERYGIWEIVKKEQKPVDEAMKSLDEHIEKAKKSWEGADAYKCIDEIRPIDPFSYEQFRKGYETGWYNATKLNKPTLMWKKIKEGEKLPCRAYLYKLAYETENNFRNGVTIDGLLVPNEPVRCGCDTWYLPADEVKNLPKEDNEE